MAEVIVPSRPSRTAARTFSVERSKRCWEITATVFPERFSASMIRSAAASVMSIGFSTTTCLPASRAATAPSACTPLGVQIVTASTSSRRSTASRSVADSAPYRAASSCALAGSRSTTATSSATSGSSASASAWTLPITPAPTRANPGFMSR